MVKMDTDQCSVDQLLQEKGEQEKKKDKREVPRGQSGTSTLHGQHRWMAGQEVARPAAHSQGGV